MHHSVEYDLLLTIDKPNVKQCHFHTQRTATDILLICNCPCILKEHDNRSPKAVIFASFLKNKHKFILIHWLRVLWSYQISFWSMHRSVEYDLLLTINKPSGQWRHCHHCPKSLYIFSVLSYHLLQVEGHFNPGLFNPKLQPQTFQPRTFQP